ncbi:MAG: cyclophane-forming radical SAM/SPASM peptide maturase GrrM/OscB [Pseudomonadota bacterium]
MLQPTPYCNLDCQYCYLPFRNDRTRMDDATLRDIGENILRSQYVDDQPPGVVWHGGEPMALPPAWYENAFSVLEDASGLKLQHAFQTNAVGVTTGWIDLWRRWGVKLGVSVDGPAQYHDANRKTRSGKGSHGLTMAGIARLQDAGLPFHTISVVTGASVRDPDGMFDFFIANGLTDLAFNVEEEEGGHSQSSLAGDQMATAYGNFLARFQDRMASARRPIRLREVEGVRHLIRRGAATAIDNMQTTPLQILSVAADGAMSTFSPEFLGVPAPDFANFAFGNVKDGGPDLILDHPAFQRLHMDIAVGVDACRQSCGYFDVCGGGAPANKYFELGSCAGTETQYCRLTVQTTLETVLETMEARQHGAA